MTAQSQFPVSAVVDALDPAWRRMVAMLFRPFDLGRWVVFAFAAWIAVIGENGSLLDFTSTIDDPETAWTHLKGFWQQHLTLLIGLTSLAIFVSIGLAVALLWLRCRGAFVFLDNLVRSEPAIARPWRSTRDLGHSLFLWSLGFWVVSFAACLMTLLPAGVAVVSALRTDEWPRAILIALSVSGPLILLLLLALSYISFFLNAVVVPLMYRHNESARAAWRRFGSLWRRSPGVLILYGLFTFMLNAGVASAILLGGILTCCCLFILAAIPYVYALVLLPIYVFMRCYALEVLRRAGPEFDLWHVQEPPPLLAAEEAVLPPS